MSAWAETVAFTAADFDTNIKAGTDTGGSGITPDIGVATDYMLRFRHDPISVNGDDISMDGMSDGTT